MTVQKILDAQAGLQDLTFYNAIPSILHRVGCPYHPVAYNQVIGELEALTGAFSHLLEASKKYAADQEALSLAIVGGMDLPPYEMEQIIRPQWIWVSPIGGGAESLILADDFEANLHTYLRGQHE
jgi:hypothetical protein